MFSQFKFVTGNANKVREAMDILGVNLEQVEVGKIFEMQTQNIEELVICNHFHENLKEKH